MITEPVVRLRSEFGLPGMVVLQFALGNDPTNPHLPANHGELSVVYTGTHDNDTTLGWWHSLSDADRAWASLDAADPAWSLLGAAWSSPAVLAIAPLQDVLSLGGEARTNHPGTQGGNWQWRFAPRRPDRRAGGTPPGANERRGPLELLFDAGGGTRTPMPAKGIRF